MRLLVACEFSGIVRDAFAAVGWDAWSCDLIPSERPGQHIIGNVLQVLDQSWDMMIAHPPCTYLTLAGIHWNNRIPCRREKTQEALEFFRVLLDAPIERICIENPVGVVSSHIRKPDQKIQPWQFGHPESKLTCFWLTNLPRLEPTDVLAPTRFQANGSPRWENQTATGQNKLGPSPDRAKIRSRTYAGIARAMADQWGRL